MVSISCMLAPFYAVNDATLGAAWAELVVMWASDRRGADMGVSPHHAPERRHGARWRGGLVARRPVQTSIVGGVKRRRK